MSGYVVVRGGSWIPTKKVYWTWLGCRIFAVTNAQCEQVVPWQGSQEATLDYYYANGLRPIRWLP